MHSSGKETDLRPSADKLARELSAPDSILANDFKARLGIDQRGTAIQVLRFLLDEADSELDEEMLTPELIGGASKLTQEECEQSRQYLLQLGILHLQATCCVDPTVSR
jgi:hypothetical protein